VEASGPEARYERARPRHEGPRHGRAHMATWECAWAMRAVSRVRPSTVQGLPGTMPQEGPCSFCCSCFGVHSTPSVSHNATPVVDDHLPVPAPRRPSPTRPRRHAARPGGSAAFEFATLPPFSPIRQVRSVMMAGPWRLYVCGALRPKKPSTITSARASRAWALAWAAAHPGTPLAYLFWPAPCAPPASVVSGRCARSLDTSRKRL